MKLNEISGVGRWSHSSEFETHYENALKNWLMTNIEPHIEKDRVLYYTHAGHDVHRDSYTAGFVSKRAPPGKGGRFMPIFPSAFRAILDGDYEVALESSKIAMNGAPFYNGKPVDPEMFLEFMQLVKMDISKLHDDPEIAAKLRAKMKKESVDDSDRRWDAKMAQAEDDKQAWRKQLFDQAEEAVKDLKIPPSWIVFYDLDEDDEPVMLFWAIDTGDNEEGGFADLGDLKDPFMDPKRTRLPPDYPHLSAAPVDENNLMIYNLAADLDMPDMDIGALHSNPEVADRLRKRQQELRKKRLSK